MPSVAQRFIVFVLGLVGSTALLTAQAPPSAAPSPLTFDAAVERANPDIHAEFSKETPRQVGDD